jgi:hypothetical protein
MADAVLFDCKVGNDGPENLLTIRTYEEFVFARKFLYFRNQKGRLIKFEDMTDNEITIELSTQNANRIRKWNLLLKYEQRFRIEELKK